MQGTWLPFDFVVNDPPTTEIYTVMNTLSLHDALPISLESRRRARSRRGSGGARGSSSPSRSEEHTSELQSLITTSYAVFCLKEKKNCQLVHRLTSRVHTVTVETGTNHK